MEEFAVAGELIHRCTKCKLDLNHRIVSMDGDKPDKVLCLTCNSKRKYKDPTKKKAKAKKADTTITTVKQKTQARLSAEEKEWKQLLGDPSITPKKYSMDGSYTLHDHVEHPKFGRGLLVEFSNPDKIHLYFDEGLKILKGKKEKNIAV